MVDGRGGFTLIEALIALVLLGFAILGVQATITDHLMSDIGTQDQQAVARQLAGNRLQAIRNDPDYSTLVARYSISEDSVPGFPGFTRSTALVDSIVYTIATVHVVTPSRRDTVTRTTVVGAP